MELTDLNLLLKLLFSHLIVDFILQTNKIVRKKREGKYQYHIIHSLTQALVTYIVAGLWNCWFIIPVIFITHFAIDLWKITQKEKLYSFIIDQVLHILVLCSLWMVITKQYAAVGDILQNIMKCDKCWIYLIGYLLILKPASIFLGLFTKRWREKGNVSESLQNAGQWIGYLERILIITFILIGKIEAIGFLLAAKSIFRFGELNKSKEIKTTEYVLIGTLASFTIAIIIGLIMNWLSIHPGSVI